MGAEGAGGELGEGGGRGSRRSGYHDDGLRCVMAGLKRSWRGEEGESCTAIPALAERSAFTRRLIGQLRHVMS
jgi:hypothetical protein